MSEKQKKPTLQDVLEAILNSEDSYPMNLDGHDVKYHDAADFEEIKRKIRSGEAQVMFAPQHHINDLGEWVDKVLEAIGRGSAVVTDMATIHDLQVEQEVVEEAADKLGIKIDQKDYIYQVAQRLKDSHEE